MFYTFREPIFSHVELFFSHLTSIFTFSIDIFSNVATFSHIEAFSHLRVPHTRTISTSKCSHIHE